MRVAIEGVASKATYEYRADRIVRLASKLARTDKLPLPPDLAGDLYYIFYFPFPRPSPDFKPLSEEDRLRLAIIGETLANARTWQIKSVTVAEPSMSTVAATIFYTALAMRLPRQQPSKPSGKNSSKRKESNVKKAVGSALQETIKGVRNASALKTILARTGAGSSSSLFFEDSLDLVLELSKRTDVSEIAKILSKIEISRLPTKRGTRAPRGWITSIEIGSDIERVHPSSLALPEELFITQLSNSRLLLFKKELYAEEGPVYVLLDKSGSMGGQKIDWARAVALALLAKARAGGRKFNVRLFDSIVYEMMSATTKSKPRAILELVKYLATVKASGGTNITSAIAKAVEDISTGRNPEGDIVLITDGEDKLSTHIIRGILGVRGIRLHSVMIQGHNPTLEKVSDSYLSVKKLGEEDALKVVKMAFSNHT